MLPVVFNEIYCAFVSFEVFIRGVLGEGEHVLNRISLLLVEPTALDADCVNQ